MALLSTVRDLHRRKGREHRQLALAEGVRLVEEMLRAGVNCKGGVISPALRTTPRGVALEAALRAAGVVVEEATDAELAAAAATEHPQGVIAVYHPREWTLEEVPAAPRHPVVVLDGVQDPGNVGAIARTAFALGAAGLLALPGTADLTNPKTVRAAMGALFRLPALHVDVDPLLAWLDRAGIVLCGATGDAPNGAFKTPNGASESPLAVAFGNEGAGLHADLLARARHRLTIPIRPDAESLNVAAAAAILLFELTR